MYMGDIIYIYIYIYIYNPKHMEYIYIFLFILTTYDTPPCLQSNVDHSPGSHIRPANMTYTMHSQLGLQSGPAQEPKSTSKANLTAKRSAPRCT